MGSKYTWAFFFGLLSFCSCLNPEYIIFTSDRTGNADIMAMDAKGKKMMPLVQTEAEEWGPTIRGEYLITFLRQSGQTIKRYEVDFLTGEENILKHPANCVLDDKNIIYYQDHQLYVCNNNIFLQRSGKAIPVNLTDTLPGKSYKPCWFPNGQQIAFTYLENGNADIYTYDIATNKYSQVTRHVSNDESPSISPDGKWLLFSSGREGNNNQDLYLYNLRTQKITNITNTPQLELIGRWSFNSKIIYFGSNQTGNWEIFSYALKSGKIKQLTNHPGFDGDPQMLRLTPF